MIIAILSGGRAGGSPSTWTSLGQKPATGPAWPRPSRLATPRVPRLRPAPPTPGWGLRSHTALAPPRPLQNLIAPQDPAPARRPPGPPLAHTLLLLQTPPSAPSPTVHLSGPPARGAGPHRRLFQNLGRTKDFIARSVRDHQASLGPSSPRDFVIASSPRQHKEALPGGPTSGLTCCLGPKPAGSSGSGAVRSPHTGKPSWSRGHSVPQLINS